MNYKGYKLKKKMSNLFYNTMRILAYPLRKSYTNEGIIYKLESRKTARGKRKRFINKIFYCLDRDRDGDCYILTNSYTDEDYSHLFDIDLWSGVDNTVLENTKWLKKNRLKVTQIDLMEFMEKYQIPSYDRELFKRYKIIKITRE